MTTPGAIRTVEEERTPRGLVFRCDLAGTGSVQVRLDWADYNHWCPDGTLPPERVVEAVLATMLEHCASVPPDFDAARVRSLVPDADAAVITHARS